MSIQSSPAAPAAPVGARGSDAQRRARRRWRPRKLTRQERRNLRLGLTFISPWILGFLAFTAYPIYRSLRLSFTEYSGFGEPFWVGWQNYELLLTDDVFWQSAWNTLYYTALAVPIGVVVALVMALAMNTKLREVGVYRAARFLPSVLPIFALSFVFIWLLNPRYGLANVLLRATGLPAVNWLGDPSWAKFSIVLLAQLGAGQTALVFLAGLRAIPATYYDAAQTDGAGVWHRFRHVTLPLLSPVILYALILGLTLGLQVFTQAYIMTGGGPANSTLFYVFYLYRNAFEYGHMGYASAMAWLLFVVTLLLAILLFRWSRRWVHYELS
jgi:multiple sugar transport system permease protein